MYIRYGINDNDEKVHELIPCLDHKTHGLIQPLISRIRSYEQVKTFLIQKFTSSLAERVRAIMPVDPNFYIRKSYMINYIGR